MENGGAGGVFISDFFGSTSKPCSLNHGNMFFFIAVLITATVAFVSYFFMRDGFASFLFAMK